MYFRLNLNLEGYAKFACFKINVQSKNLVV